MDVETVEQDDVTIFRDARIAVAYSGIALGNVSYIYSDSGRNDDEQVTARRERLKLAVGVDRCTLLLTSEPGGLLDVSNLPLPDVPVDYSGEILFTNTPEKATACNPADCDTLTLYSAAGHQVLGFAHVGRKSVDAGTHMIALGYMIDHYRVPLKDVRIFFAPSIAPESYVFSEDALRQRHLDTPEWKPHVIMRAGNGLVDVRGRILRDFKAAYPDMDIDTQIFCANIDTGSDPRYYSHARAGDKEVPEGRNGVIATLVA